ncbi:hypothetical protein [Chitinasiproducens palmae]|uniref:Uncharacterized protein n=1 Tax=Chitinasiproducens palmae TaxID=1770053 RepID=A0A1H2PMF6_9BURK|nr:hypothetical protein [Chitinasiproducens palmae]SDV47294.1 hypothetical protein SAMN05216551_102451 [Chitinasiproducens palmae]
MPNADRSPPAPPTQGQRRRAAPLNAGQPSPYPSPAGLVLPPDDALRAVLGELYGPDKALNVVKMLAGTGALFDAARRFLTAVFEEKGIDAGVREMIILRTAAVLDVP